MDSKDQKSESPLPPKGKFDPGWNDPPTFSYNPQANTIKPKLALNKRVAFPLSGNSSAPPIPNQLPPPPPINPVLPINSLIPMNPTPQTIPMVPNNVNSPGLNVNNDCTDENIDVDEIVNILNEILNDNQELGNKLEDIRKKINIMRTMWIEDKLPNSVKVSTVNLVKALKDSDTATADEIHKSLMVDYVSCVRSWMVGLKQLIFHCAAKNDLLKIDESEKHEES